MSGEAAGLVVASGTIAATLITSMAYLTKKIKKCHCCGCHCEQTTTDPSPTNGSEEGSQHHPTPRLWRKRPGNHSPPSDL